jgi:HNH endonuclease
MPPTYTSALFYNPANGDLWWRRRPRQHFSTDRDWRIWNMKHAGQIAGTINKGGRRMVGTRLVSRIAWKMQTGADPIGIVDHRDRDPLNNRWRNFARGNEPPKRLEPGAKESEWFANRCEIGVRPISSAMRHQRPARLFGHIRHAGGGIREISGARKASPGCIRASVGFYVGR